MPRTYAMAWYRRSARFFIPQLLLGLLAGNVQAQGLHPPTASGPYLTGWQGAAALGAVGALLLVDNGTTQLVATHHSALGDGLAGGFRRMGQPEVFATAALGTWAVGLASGSQQLQGAGMRMTASVGLAGLTTHGLKFLLGRARPNADDADDFRLLGPGRSMPSGHTTVAFALAASAADEIRNPVATVLLYGAAAGAGMSRMYDRKHWMSDVVLGAAIGITSAKFVNGRWSVFGLRAPNFLITAGGVGVTLPLPN